MRNVRDRREQGVLQDEVASLKLELAKVQTALLQTATPQATAVVMNSVCNHNRTSRRGGFGSSPACRTVKFLLRIVIREQVTRDTHPLPIQKSVLLGRQSRQQLVSFCLGNNPLIV